MQKGIKTNMKCTIFIKISLNFGNFFIIKKGAITTIRKLKGGGKAINAE